ncbi:hypothetical protein K458DRAFT_419209 [Lentithecium fluviatile CBS 122367]|uniref:Uncharacterized protein n=1 Tax=Lentithecium fluviatile CBS 122367 TaxID=1168545 RepID=A0A6G1IXI0_9PLEO|nr:hypothetical protein K458DRAFT_419209 [Lentithecium fluviatile CBS 122367]
MRLLLPISLLAFSTTISATATHLTPRSDPGGPCKQKNDCYGGANCCAEICKLGNCNSPANPGAACVNNGYCFGGAQCCLGVCKLGSCRMDGSCDADNDCYGWCHNNSGKCSIPKGKQEGTCKCAPETCYVA